MTKRSPRVIVPVCLGLAALLAALIPAAAESVPAESALTKAVEAPVPQEATVPRSVTAIPLSGVLDASRQVDELVEAGYAKHGVEPNALASDEVFLRRVYLDAVGRIPTYEEARAFLDSTDPLKRSRLIDQLLDSEGYVSHYFNYFADLLRLQSRMRYAPSAPYLDFVKRSLRENKPYDQFVRELITAEGYTWDDGAAGYYIRDTGMPLDNMSNTVQVFLGTQLVCAQCHNHPFDSWTQKQYYQLAAFTYGIETRDRSHPLYAAVREMRRNDEVDREVGRAARRILRPLAYRPHETGRKLRLPDDYQYLDAEPEAVIDPASIFGEEVEVREGDSPKEIYARWMTSPRNPRFATVIANRLWKQVMGVGVIEPVDDIKETVEPSNPELMKYLTEQMVARRFDLKQYLRMLLNTKTYQREVATNDLAEDETYHFPGPVLRRQSAEQLWDSILTMTIPYVDERQGVVRTRRYTDGEDLVDKELDEIMAMARDEALIRQARIELREQSADLQADLRVASRTNDREAVNRLRDEIDKIRERIYGPEVEGAQQRRRERERETARENDPRWAGFSRDLVRASEIESPARPRHFLRQFGQSDRETIENASTEATVPQILTMLNGPIYSQLAARRSVLSQNIAAASDAEEKLDVIVLSILSRRPTAEEKGLLLPEIADGDQGLSNVVWALLNTRQFLFVQ